MADLTSGSGLTLSTARTRPEHPAAWLRISSPLKDSALAFLHSSPLQPVFGHNFDGSGLRSLGFRQRASDRVGVAGGGVAAVNVTHTERRESSYSALRAALTRLGYNLRWTWQPSTTRLFASLAPD